VLPARIGWIVAGAVAAVGAAAAVLILAMSAIFTTSSAGALALAAAAAGSGCGAPAAASQPAASAKAGSIPADYLKWYKTTGQQYGIPWTVLAGIGTEESDNGQTTLPGVHSGSNSAGAAGPMQIGIGGAAGNQWGGAPVHPASEVVSGVATDENADGTASVYDPADAIAGAAKYLIEHGAKTSMAAAIFAYNHATWYVQQVEAYASQYAKGGYTVTAATSQSAPGCGSTQVATGTSAKVQAVIAWAEAQSGTLYQYGGSCTDPHSSNMALHCDCSSLVQQSFAHGAGLQLPRTAQAQWQWGEAGHAQVIPLSQAQAGDVVYFPSYLGRDTEGHTGIITDPTTMTMINAPETGKPVGFASYNPAGLPYGNHMFTILRFINTSANPGTAAGSRP
jgi:cell wall-associated NlpC family hydrolase